MQNQSQFDKNKEYLETRFAGFCEEIEKLQDQPDVSVCEYEIKDGQKGLGIHNDSGVIQLNSRFTSKVYAQLWAEHVIEKEEVSREHVIVVFGFGNGDYVRALVEKMPKDSRLFCYEPSASLFLKAMENVDLEDVLSDKAVVFVEGLNMEYFNNYWRAVVDYANGQLIHAAALPVYPRLFPEKLNQLVARIQEQNNITQIFWNTKKRFSRAFTLNQTAMLPYLLESYSLAELIERLPENYPAIVVAAGPSLKKNIKEIKKAKNKALIIAIDTSIKLLLEEGITPDINVTIDPEKPLELFEDERVHDVPVCICPFSVRESFERQRNKVFISLGNSYIGKVCQEYNKEIGFLGDGGTVAQDAFSLALSARMSPIILVGQDLAYTDDQTHAEGAYKKQNNVKDMDENEYIWVEDIYGNPVKTIGNLDLYRRWYENILKTKQAEGIRVIDATEGGAKIAGTEIWKLKDVIEQECTREFNYEEVIASVSKLFSEEEQAELKEKYRELPKLFKDIQKRSSEEAEIYGQLLELSEAECLDVEAIKACMKKFGEQGEALDESLEYSLIEPYVEEAAEKAMMNLEVTKEDAKEDLKNVAERGLVMMEAIQNAVPELLPEIEKIIEKL